MWSGKIFHFSEKGLLAPTENTLHDLHTTTYFYSPIFRICSALTPIDFFVICFKYFTLQIVKSHNMVKSKSAKHHSLLVLFGFKKLLQNNLMQTHATLKSCNVFMRKHQAMNNFSRYIYKNDCRWNLGEFSKFKCP